MIDTKRLATDAAYWDECGAPEDATHYFMSGGHRCAGFYKLANGVALFFGHEGWSDHCSNPFLTDRPSIPRPQARQMEWDGEGFPPVGCDCYMAHKYDHHLEEVAVKVVCYTSQLAIVANNVGTEYALSKDHVSFRTKEQREREELKAFLSEAVCESDGINKRQIMDDLTDAILSRYSLEPKK